MHLQLLQPHTHGGQRLAPGDSLYLEADLAQWLINCSVACERVDPPHPPGAPSVTAPPSPLNDPTQSSDEEPAS